jgi:hypothetical protein
MSKKIKSGANKDHFRMVRILTPPGTRPQHLRSVKAVSQGEKYRVKCPWSETNLFRGRGAQHDGVFRADEHFVLDAHSEAVEVFRELRIGRDVDTFEHGSREGISTDAERKQGSIQRYRARW